MLRLAPGERAAEITPADTELHRHEIVNGRGHAVAGKTHEDSALLDEARHTVMIGTGNGTDIGEHKGRDVARQPVADRAFLYVGIGRERARKIPGLRQQRLLVLSTARGHDLDGSPP